MKRLWPPTNGVYKRREHEAVLFERGLPNIIRSSTQDRGDAAGADPDLVVQVQTQSCGAWLLRHRRTSTAS